jgi:Uma2 family endonuclease
MTVPAASPIQSPRPAQSKPGMVRYRLTVRQFDKMIDAGIFRERDHLELLGGVLVDKMTKHDPHNFTVAMLATVLRSMSLAGCFILEEKSVQLSRWSRPEPDIAFIRGELRDFRKHGPKAPDLAALIEVADSSYTKDRGPKWRMYAAAGIPVYWIVNCPLRRIDIYSEPSGRGKSAVYSSVKVYEEHEEIPVLLEERELGRFKVSDVLA